MSAITVDLDKSQHAVDLKRILGLDDRQLIVSALAVYWVLVNENPDGLLRFIRENGEVATMALTAAVQKDLNERVRRNGT